MKKLKKFIKPFFPYIFFPYVFKDVLNSLLHPKKTKHHFEYENNFYKRHAYISKAISNYKDCKYLEIGVGSNDLFNSIPLKLENKYGVDPDKGGNFRMTSDEFFKNYFNLKFDVIFIDGLHKYEQCQRDCINSMKQLNPDGVILLHDMLPRSYFEEHIPRKQESWTGDVWKVAVEISNSNNIEFKIVNIDMGIGILKLKDKFEYKRMNELKNKNFEDFLNYHKELPIINSENGLEFLNKK